LARRQRSGNAARTTADAAPVALIARRQPLRLVQAHAAIDDKAMRVALLALTEGMARMARTRR
jgi:hypothetical protein